MKNGGGQKLPPMTGGTHRLNVLASFPTALIFMPSGAVDIMLS